jgi:hypothetical protein
VTEKSTFPIADPPCAYFMRCEKSDGVIASHARNAAHKKEL